RHQLSEREPQGLGRIRQDPEVLSTDQKKSVLPSGRTLFFIFAVIVQTDRVPVTGKSFFMLFQADHRIFVIRTVSFLIFDRPSDF
ncbi:hypothetical protein J5839_01155, partial [Methanosarcinaceae archaeon]|nr:hypothetical protein [Methanosarcinaceae archaeon]